MVEFEWGSYEGENFLEVIVLGDVIYSWILFLGISLVFDIEDLG